MIEKKLFGKMPCGCEVYEYTLSNSSKTSFSVITYGGTLKNLWAPDKNGETKDVVWGFDTLDGYISSAGCQGALIGRVANRIGKGRFEIDGVEYQLYKNDGNNSLHGGKIGYDKKIWSAEAFDSDEPYIELSYFSPDGEENFPGNLNVKVTYKLSENGSLSIHYEAVTDKKTYVNMTNHAYFILGGIGSGVIDDNLLWIDSDKINSVDNELIPDSGFIPVKGSPYDFTEIRRVGDGFDADHPLMKEFCGYDNNYVCRDYDGTLKLRAVLADPGSGRKINLYTDQPCVQIYTGNMIKLDDPAFKGGIPQYRHCAVCLETQAMPDAMNHPGFTDIMLNPGEKYDTTTVFELTLD